MRVKKTGMILGMIISAALLAACGKGSGKTEATADPGILRVGIVNGEDRFASNVAGAPVGIEADIAKLVADGGGYSIQFGMVNDTDALLTGLMNGEYDLAFGRIPQTDPRISTLTSSAVYGKGGLFLVTPKYNYMDCISIMQAGTLGISPLTDPIKDEVEGIDAIVKVAYPSLDQMGNDIASGTILAGLANEREAMGLIGDTLQAQEVLSSPKEEYVAVMPQGSPLKTTVNDAIKQYKLNKIQQTGEGGS